MTITAARSVVTKRGLADKALLTLLETDGVDHSLSWTHLRPASMTDHFEESMTMAPG